VTKTASLSVSLSASVQAEAGVIFAQASATAGVTLDKSWSSTETWTYSGKAPKKKIKGKPRFWRQRFWHETRQFYAAKWVHTPGGGCYTYHVAWKKKINAPVMGDDADDYLQWEYGKPYKPRPA
jgi:hypothetical protein